MQTWKHKKHKGIPKFKYTCSDCNFSTINNKSLQLHIKSPQHQRKSFELFLKAFPSSSQIVQLDRVAVFYTPRHSLSAPISIPFSFFTLQFFYTPLFCFNTQDGVAVLSDRTMSRNREIGLNNHKSVYEHHEHVFFSCPKIMNRQFIKTRWGYPPTNFSTLRYIKHNFARDVSLTINKDVCENLYSLTAACQFHSNNS